VQSAPQTGGGSG